jgi:hypothetical protein
VIDSTRSQGRPHRRWQLVAKISRRLLPDAAEAAQEAISDGPQL